MKISKPYHGFIAKAMERNDFKVLTGGKFIAEFINVNTHSPQAGLALYTPKPSISGIMMSEIMQRLYSTGAAF